MIEAIAVSGHNGLRHTLCKTVLPMSFDAPAHPAGRLGLLALPVAHAGCRQPPCLPAARPPPRGTPLLNILDVSGCIGYFLFTRWQRAVSSKAVRTGGFCFIEVFMPLTFHPKPGMVLICDYSTGFKPPEMVKRRPVVVISPRPRRKTQLCIVVPLSSTPPVPVESCHHQLDPASLPGPLSSTPTWAKCDMLATVSLDRLDRVKLGRDAKGKRLYSTQSVTEDDFKEIQRSVLHALGFHQLTKIVP